MVADWAAGTSWHEEYHRQVERLTSRGLAFHFLKTNLLLLPVEIHARIHPPLYYHHESLNHCYRSRSGSKRYDPNNKMECRQLPSRCDRNYGGLSSSIFSYGGLFEFSMGNIYLDTLCVL